MQIKLLFQSGFDETELKGYIPVIHANVYQTIKVWNIWKGVLVVSLWFMSHLIIGCIKYHDTIVDVEVLYLESDLARIVSYRYYTMDQRNYL